MYYIIDTYTPYAKNSNVKYVFEYNNLMWCIREVDKFEWGKPQFDEQPLENDFIDFHIYNTFEEALRFCRELKGVII